MDIFEAIEMASKEIGESVEVMARKPLSGGVEFEVRLSVFPEDKASQHIQFTVARDELGDEFVRVFNKKFKYSVETLRQELTKG